jgi:hypothetical protein
VAKLIATHRQFCRHRSVGVSRLPLSSRPSMSKHILGGSYIGRGDLSTFRCWRLRPEVLGRCWRLRPEVLGEIAVQKAPINHPAI